ncbi:MAG TPA: M56 family metallopeptidase [Acidisarcina sp.]
MSMTFAPWAPALINHLWQTTVFTAAVWLLALTLRGNQARTRYWLWMIASLKFLVPFSLLIAAGACFQTFVAGQFSWSGQANPKVTAVMEGFAQPFSPAPSSSLFESSAASASAVVAASHPAARLLPFLMLGVWICGALLLALSWARRWSTIRSAMRTASSIGARSHAQVMGVPVMESPTLSEPGVFGILSPVLLLPEGITERLTAAQLGAILDHEMCHVRRRDNLTAALHMVVETLFWFHPAVWWIRTRLVEERERACDEAVIQAGSAAEVYAEGILNVCKFYVESPLPCVSGVTGSELKQRIVRIMAGRVALKLNLGRKLLLLAAALTVVAVPIMFGVVHITEVRAQTAAGKDITGAWQGTLNAGGHDLRVIAKITREGGALKTAFYSIDQAPLPFPANKTTFEGGTLKFEITGIGGSYDGRYGADGDTITGTWTQASQPFPLNLKRATPSTAWDIPEPPPKLAPMAANAPAEFDVATIKPSKPDSPGKMFRVNGREFSTLNTTLNDLMNFAYGLHPRQIVGAPAWMDSDKFDLLAKPAGEGQPDDKQWKSMVQKLLAERFKLTYHQDKKDLSVYALTLAKTGPKMDKSTGDPKGLPALFFTQLGVLNVRNSSMGAFAQLMQSAVLDRPVVDQTGLAGNYDFVLKWTPDESQFGGMGVKVPPPTEDPNAPPPLFTAIQEQIGLKLDPSRAAVDVFVIDHVEKPTEN